MDITLRYLLKKLLSSCLDVLPVILVIAFFQILVIQKPFPNLPETLFGFILVIAGLFIFVQGLEIGLFPIGERMANQFAARFLTQFNVSYATVVEDNKIVGLVSLNGIVTQWQD